MKTADLSEQELQALFGEAIKEKFEEFLDPNRGLEIRNNFVQELETVTASKEQSPF